jgi:prolyl-tRNA synthetase
VVVLVVKDDPEVCRAADTVVSELRAAGHRVRLDARTDTGFGRRSIDWELKGVPARVEVGPRDLADGMVTVVTRHRRTKANVALASVVETVDTILGSVATELLAEATATRETRTADAATLEEAVVAGSEGFARVPFRALGPDGEDRLAEHALTVRCLQRADGSLAVPGDDEAGLVAIVGRSY